MTARYAVVGAVSGELLSHGGAVLVHDNPHELAWLIPGHRVIPLPRGDWDRPVLPLRHHPDMQSVRWPLDKRDFVGG